MSVTPSHKHILVLCLQFTRMPAVDRLTQRVDGLCCLVGKGSMQAIAARFIYVNYQEAL